jgi:patatin-like phospholipase/acyl hydrolase
MAKYTRILSLDGGGIRGIIAAQVVVSIESKLQQKSGNPDARITDYFDLIFDQIDARKYPAEDYFIKDIARARSAAPSYFEVAKIYSLTNESYALMDGGVFANNPALCAYAEVRNKFRISGRSQRQRPDSKRYGNFIAGREAQKNFPYEEAKNWGQVEWVEPLIHIMMTGVAETVNYQIIQIYDAIERPNQYLRITPDLSKEKPLPIDDASEEKISELLRIGNEQASKYKEQLDKFIDLLLAE